MRSPISDHLPRVQSRVPRLHVRFRGISGGLIWDSGAHKGPVVPARREQGRQTVSVDEVG